MNWEVLNGVTGLVSAICAVAGIAYLGISKSDHHQSTSFVNTRKVASFIVVCSGWALCCLSFLWVIEPFGSFVSDKDYQKFFGIILGLPAIIIFIFGLDVMQESKHNKSSNLTGEKDSPSS